MAGKSRLVTLCFTFYHEYQQQFSDGSSSVAWKIMFLKMPCLVFSKEMALTLEHSCGLLAGLCPLWKYRINAVRQVIFYPSDSPTNIHRTIHISFTLYPWKCKYDLIHKSMYTKFIGLERTWVLFKPYLLMYNQINGIEL